MGTSRSFSGRRRLAGFCLALLAALAAAAVAYSGRRHPAGARLGNALEGPAGSFSGPAPPLAEGASILVATFNIHGGKGRDGRRDLERTAASLRAAARHAAGAPLGKFAFVGLNEVHASFFGGRDQAQRLGQELALAWLFAPTEVRWGFEHFGNGLLSALPVVSWERRPLLSGATGDYRNLVHAQARCWDGLLHLVVTHIDRGEARQGQLREVFAFFLTLPKPAILLGDLNSTRADALLSELLAGNAEVQDAFGDGAGLSSIDWILLRGLRCPRSGRFDDGASDHPLHWAELAIDS